MASIKVVSFDLDGTLGDQRYVDSVWFEGIPRLYSDKEKVSFNHALDFVRREYDKVGKERVEWYDLRYWLSRFGLDADPREVLKQFEHQIRIHPEVSHVLERLKRQGFRLDVVTNAHTDFVEVQLEKTGIGDCFEKIFSSTSDFHLVKKSAKLYQSVCDILEVSPNEMIHTGDDWDFDCATPRRLGIEAYYLDRTGRSNGEYVIHSLDELPIKVSLDM